MSRTLACINMFKDFLAHRGLRLYGKIFNASIKPMTGIICQNKAKEPGWIALDTFCSQIFSTLHIVGTIVQRLVYMFKGHRTHPSNCLQSIPYSSPANLCTLCSQLFTTLYIVGTIV